MTVVDFDMARMRFYNGMFTVVKTTHVSWHIHPEYLTFHSYVVAPNRTEHNLTAAGLGGIV